MTYPKIQIIKMADSHNTIGTTAMLPADQPHSGRTAPIPAVVPISNEDQNFEKQLLWNSSTAIYQSVQPPCGRTAHNTPVVPIILTALIDFTKTREPRNDMVRPHKPNSTDLNPCQLLITLMETRPHGLSISPLMRILTNSEKAFKKSLSLKNPTWSKE